MPNDHREREPVAQHLQEFLDDDGADACARSRHAARTVAPRSDAACRQLSCARRGIRLMNTSSRSARLAPSASPDGRGTVRSRVSERVALAAADVQRRAERGDAAARRARRAASAARRSAPGPAGHDHVDQAGLAR